MTTDHERPLRLPVAAEPRLIGAVLAVGLVALVVPSGPGLVLAVGLAGVGLLTVVDIVRAPAPGSLGLAREVDEVQVVDRDASLTLVVTNPHRRRLRLAVHDATSPSLNRTPRRHPHVAVPPGGRARLESRLRPERRGERHLGPVTVRVAGPLGLGARQQVVALPQTLKVHPRLPGRRAVLARLTDPRLQPVGSRATHLRGPGTTYDSLREYHPDDEFRHINWLATARTGGPISNVYTQERNQHVLILLDASRMHAGAVEGVPRLEFAIDAAVALAELAGRLGDHVGLLGFDDEVRTHIPPRTGPSQARRILDAIFDLEPSLTAPAYRAAFGHLLARNRRRALLVLLTDLTEETAMEPLLQAVPVLTHRHIVTVAAVRDPSLDRAATSLPTSADAAFHKAAAAAAMAARDRTASRLRRLGARVLDGPPATLATRLADHYVEVKRSGAL